MTRASIAVLFAFGLLTGCGKSEPERFVLKNAVISSGEGDLPNAYPAFTRYPGSEIVLTGIYTETSFFGDPEGAAVLRTPDDAGKVEAYYAESFEKNGWNVIQSQRKSGEILILAESPFRRLITVILRNSAPTAIRLYTKRPGGN